MGYFSGSETSRISKVRTLVNMELVDQNITLLGKEGVIPPLLEMASGNVESQEASLSALVKLSGCHANKELIAAAGGVPIIVDLIFSPHTAIIIARCCEVLEKLTSNDDGIKFLVDKNKKQLEIEQIIKKLLAFLQSPNSSNIMLRPALRALLGICKSEARFIKTAVLTANGVSLILPLLDGSDPEIREIAINLLSLFSQHEPEGVVEYLLKPKRLEALVGFLENGDKADVQMAAAGLLANLPKSEVPLTMKLIELEGLNAIISILRSGTMGAKENALTALFRFTDPANLDSQRKVVELGAYPLLVRFLRFGSVTAKARAAALIGNLSTSSPELAVVPKPARCLCFRSSRVPLCPAHGGICSVETTFCLLKADALAGLVALLHEEIDATAYEAIQTLSTLVREDSPQRGANVLHEADAINPTLEILNWGPGPLKEQALVLLEKVLTVKEMVEKYGSIARLRLVDITGRINIHEDGNFRRKAAGVLALLERYSGFDTSSLATGLNG